MEAYLQSALNVTRLALQARKAPDSDAASVVMLLLLAELDERWEELGSRSELPTPAEIRQLLGN